MGTANRIESLRPEDGEYSLVEIDKGARVEEAGHRIAEFEDADEVAIPPDTDFESYVVYDRAGNSYTRESWPEPFAETPDGTEEKAEYDNLPDFMRGGGSRNF